MQRGRITASAGYDSGGHSRPGFWSGHPPEASLSIWSPQLFEKRLTGFTNVGIGVSGNATRQGKRFWTINLINDFQRPPKFLVVGTLKEWLNEREDVVSEPFSRNRKNEFLCELCNLVLPRREGKELRHHRSPVLLWHY